MKVLDACCGCKMMWFDKNNSKVLFADIRKESMSIDHLPSQRGRNPKICDPDCISDFRKMVFPDNYFDHVVFDPPHVTNLSMKSVTGFSYGSLSIDNWEDDIQQGFKECFRVLKSKGTLIFKWNEINISLKKILKLTPQKPLYGHKSGKKAQTHWVAFLKD